MEPFAGFFVLLLVAAPIIVLVIFIARVNALSSRVQWLEKELLRLRSGLHYPPAAIESFALQPASPIPAHIPSKVPPPDPPMTAPVSSAASPPMYVPAAEPSRAREEWESFVGGKLLNRIGALALIIGTGFFLKYAFDNNWISESVRVMIGGFAGIALLLLGARFHRKEYRVFAQGLFGSGIAILYLSVFASFNFYNLVSQTGAFVLMSAVTAIAFYHAFRFDSLAISILGWAGGYLTPFMLSTGVANEIGLFTYVDILEAGLLAIVIIRQSWMILELLAFLGTYFTFTLWQAKYYSEDALLLTVLFLTLFWLLLYVADLYRVVTRQPSHPLRQFLNILNTAVYYAYLYTLVNKQHHEIMGLLTLILAALYALPVLLTLRAQSDPSMLRDYLLTTVVLVVIATSLQFLGFVTVVLWSCEAVVLLWCARRWSVPYIVNAALIFIPIIIVKLFTTDASLTYTPIENFSLVINKRFLTFVFVAASLGSGAHLLAGSETRELKYFSSILRMGAVVLLLILFSAEVRDSFELSIVELRQQESGPVMTTDIRSLENMKQLSLSALWLCYGIALMVGGIWQRSRETRILAIVILGMSILKIFIYDLSSLQTLYRIFSFIGLGMMLLTASYMYQKYKDVIFGSPPTKGEVETIPLE